VGLYQLYRWSFERQVKKKYGDVHLKDHFPEVVITELEEWGLIFPESDWTQLVLMPPPAKAYSLAEAGLPFEFEGPHLRWKPQFGQSWKEFTEDFRAKSEQLLAQYKEDSLNLQPSLAHLRGYAHYAELAKFQARLLIGSVDEAALKRIRRTAQRLQVTLRDTVAARHVSGQKTHCHAKKNQEAQHKPND
jgi:hypothetical protein